MACGTCEDQCYCAIGAADTSIAVTGNGGGDLPYAVRVRRSATTDNQIQLLGDGIYVASTATVSANRSICTSSTRPAGFTGLEIFETDTGRTYVYNGSSWIWQRSLNGEDVVRINVTASTSSYISTSMGDFLSLGNVTVPPWAVRVSVSLTTAGLYFASGSTGTAQFRFRLGSDNSATTGQIFIGDATRTAPVPINDVYSIAASGGSRTANLQAQKVTGSTALSADASTVTTAVLRFLPA